MTREEAAALELTFGKFKGYTLGQVLIMTAREAQRVTNNGYQRSGKRYVQWMAQQYSTSPAFRAARVLMGTEESKDTGELVGLLHSLGVDW